MLTSTGENQKHRGDYSHAPLSDVYKGKFINLLDTYLLRISSVSETGSYQHFETKAQALSSRSL